MHYTDQDIKDEAYRIYERRKQSNEPDYANDKENFRRAEEFLRLMDTVHRGDN